MTDRNRRPDGRPAGAAPTRPRRPAPAAGAHRSPARRAPARGGWLALPDHRYQLMKWLLLAALVVYAVLVVGANSARDVDFSQISNRMAAAPGLEGLKALDENGFQDRLGTAPEGCEDWLMYGADEVMNVSELMIAKSGDAATLDRLEAAARARVEAQLDVFRSYGVEQKGLLEGAAIRRRGSYLFYGVGEHTDAWEDAFLSCVR